MSELTKAQRGRLAIRVFKITADALALRGYYKPSGKSGQTLEHALREISPEIYGTMNDERSIELDGLEYVIDRLPKGIEECTRIVLTAQEDLANTAFEKIEPLKRRRISYRMSESEICFVITRGLSEVYDVITHLTFLNIEAEKIHQQMKDPTGETSKAWKELGRTIENLDSMDVEKLDQAVWNLSILLGRTYQETKAVYEALEKNRIDHNSNNGLFRTVYFLGNRVERSHTQKDEELLIYFTPSFRDMIAHQKVSRMWGISVKQKLKELGLLHKPIHIISANMHSVMNTLYGHSYFFQRAHAVDGVDLYETVKTIKDETDQVKEYAESNGMTHVEDTSGANIDYQIIDLSKLNNVAFHPDIKRGEGLSDSVILVMDYAFGTQAFEVMDELLNPLDEDPELNMKTARSISIMGKAGILPGSKGDIMLGTAHVAEGSAHNYPVDNDICPEDFDGSIDVYVGPILTVLGTSLQNRDVLEKFQNTSWKAIGLEMEGGHYQRAIEAAKIRGHILKNVKVRYAYYASDNPLKSGQTLASGGMGDEGIKPTYMITKAILEKIINDTNE